MADNGVAGVADIGFGREICNDPSQAEQREWWLSNGRGGYAAGTLLGTLTRRYHGLLVVPVQPPLGRWLLLAKAEASLCHADGRSWELYTNRWLGEKMAPEGYRHLESFHLRGRMPVWRFACDEARLEQRLWMPHGRQASRAAYRLSLGGAASADWQLRIKLLINNRNHHQCMAGREFFPRIEHRGAWISIFTNDHLILRVHAPASRTRVDPIWYERFLLSRERDRGLDHVDNHLCIGELLWDLQPETWVGFTATAEGAAADADNPAPNGDHSEAMAAFFTRERRLLAVAEAVHPALAVAPDWVRRLVLAADAFLFERQAAGEPAGKSIIAGYPWFEDWGRDAMIALPGLTLATGRYDCAREILLTFARYQKDGLLPNILSGAAGRPEYNSVDAGLWYLEAWRAYLARTQDWSALRLALPVLEALIAAYRRGTRFGIVLDQEDGLLRSGEPGVQVTWMDAKVGERVITPRIGKAVEVNALWYNGLCTLADWLGRGDLPSDQPAAQYRTWADATRRGFQRFLQSDPALGLKDVLDGPEGDEAALRPNQILAVSLHYSPLEPEVRRRVVDCCARHLLTSYGLRSLAPGQPQYHGNYQGSMVARDEAYHQGTIWTWLLGQYVRAEHRVYGQAALSLGRLAALGDHLAHAGLGSLSEIFDGDAPHRPRGAPCQAWSVAVTLDAWLALSDAESQAASPTQGAADRRTTRFPMT